MKINDCIIINDNDEYFKFLEMISVRSDLDEIWLKKELNYFDFPVIFYIEKGGIEYSSMTWYKKHGHKYKSIHIKSLIRLEKLKKLKNNEYEN